MSEVEALIILVKSENKNIMLCIPYKKK